MPRSPLIYSPLGKRHESMAYTTSTTLSVLYELPSPTRSKASVPFILPSTDATMSTQPTPSFRRRAVPVDVFTKPQSSRSSPKAPSTKPPSRTLQSCGAQALNGRASSQVADASIPHLREALLSIDTKMASLMSERDAIESRLEQAVRRQSPIQRLPSELLASVFTIGVLDTCDENPLMPSTLMLVCRYWAEVAANTPFLWSHISVGDHDSVEKARRRVSRSKSVPLDISISFNPKLNDTGGTLETVIRAMDVLQCSIPRWRSFRLSVPNRQEAHAALSRCRVKAPRLELLQVKIHYAVQEDIYSSHPLSLFSGDLPLLKTCSFDSFNFGWDAGLVRGLKVLELGMYWNEYAPSVTTVLSILRACPELEEFALRKMSDVDEESITMFERDLSVTATQATSSSSSSHTRHRSSHPPHTIHLPRLTRLSFYYAGINRACAILSQVSTPSLETLELCYMDDITPVLRHLKRQSAFSILPLRHLKIEVSLFSEMDLFGFLARTPFLTGLELVDIEIASSKLLKALSAPSAPQSWTCPKLETLSVEGCTSLEWDSLRTLVESRLPSQSNPHLQNRSRDLHASSTSHPYAATATSLRHTSLSSSSQPPRALFSSHSKSLSHHPNHSHHSQQHGMGNRSHSAPPKTTIPGVWPVRLKSVDVTRCHQISKEMVQWLRMLVVEVKCDAKRPWGESTFL